MKRTLSLIVSFVMIATMVSLPTGVFAEENTGNDGTIRSISAAHVNPLYEDIVDESDISVPEAVNIPESDSARNQARTLKNAEYLTTEAALVQTLRDQLKARQETITLYYKKTASVDYSQQFFYNIFNAALVHTGMPAEGDYLKWHWKTWGASLSWYSREGMDYITLIYNVSYHTTAAQEAEVDKAVDEVMTFLDLNAPGKSDYVKVRAIYDYICSNVTYDNANLNNGAYRLKFTAYAAFINGTAVCQGYASMFYRLVMEAGIDARIVAGDYNNTFTGVGIGNDDHGWNIVEVDDQYYNLDATWDGDESPFVMPYRHRFFLMSGGTATSTFDSNHIRWPEYDTVSFHSAYPMSPTDYTAASSSTPINISEWAAHLEYYRTPEEGTPKTPGVIVPGLVEGTDFRVTYSGNNVEADNTVTVTITGIGSYTGTITETFFIGKNIAAKKSAASLSQTNYVYDGSAKTPAVTIEGLREGTDFQVEYRNNINTGTGIATITGIGEYVGSFDLTFAINSIAIGSSNTTITLGASSYAYDGGYKKPGITVVCSGRTLVNGTDYTASYENNLYPGTATAIVTGKGNYGGSLTRQFTITGPVIAAPNSLTVKLYGYNDLKAEWSNVAVAGATPKYKVEYQRGEEGWTTLKDGTTSSSIKKANLSDGAGYRFRVTPYVTLDGKSYYGKAKLSSYAYTLKKLSKPKVTKKSGSQIKISWKNIQGETGYQIARSAKKSKGYSTVKTVKGANAKSASIKAARSSSYYYKVRAYKTVNGKKICGPWSNPVKYRLK